MNRLIHKDYTFLFIYILLGHNKYLFSVIFLDDVPHKMYWKEKLTVSLPTHSLITCHYKFLTSLSLLMVAGYEWVGTLRERDSYCRICWIITWPDHDHKDSKELGTYTWSGQVNPALMRQFLLSLPLIFLWILDQHKLSRSDGLWPVQD
jgi:hypothetical protein